jgi:mono/diheme cytochrome c family protein
MRITMLLLSGAVALCAQTPTYHRDVAPILQRHCVSCHKAGQMAPFPLTSYEDARRAAPAIHAAVQGRRMPPDEKNPHHGRDYFERTLRQKDLQTVVKWIEAGAPEGEKKK